MSTRDDAALSPREIEENVTYIAAALGELSMGDCEMARVADVGARLELLRTQYRAHAESFNGHLPRLGELSRQFDVLLESRLPQVVDRFHQVAEGIHRAEQEKEFWRGYLIAKAPPGRRETLSGTTADVVIRSTESRLLPPPGSEPRVRLERLVQEAGRWQEVSQLSRPKLQGALQKSRFGAAEQQAISELCPLTVVHQVSSRRRTA